MGSKEREREKGEEEVAQCVWPRVDQELSSTPEGLFMNNYEPVMQSETLSNNLRLNSQSQEDHD